MHLASELLGSDYTAQRNTNNSSIFESAEAIV